MDEAAIDRLELGIGIFLRQLQLHAQNTNILMRKSTSALLSNVVLTINELKTNATLIEGHNHGSNVQFLFDLDEQVYDLRHYITCRVCLEHILVTKDEFDAHQRKHNIMLCEMRENQVMHNDFVEPVSYANVLNAASNVNETNMASSSANGVSYHVEPNGNHTDTVNSGGNTQHGLQWSAIMSEPELAAEDNKNESIEYEWDSTYLIRIQGLAWSVTKKEIYDFFSNVNILNGVNGIHFISEEGCDFGQAYIQLDTHRDYQLAQTYHKQYMGERLIKILPANVDDFQQTMRKRNPLVDDKIVRVANLRAGTMESDIRAFFNGLMVNKIHMVYDGMAVKEAFVQFATNEDCDSGLRRGGEMLRNKRAIIFRSFEKNLPNFGKAAMRKASQQSFHSTTTAAVVSSPSASTSSQSKPASNGTTYDMTENYCSHMVMASGFPWNITKKEIRDFFSGSSILHGDDGIFLLKENAMKAYIQFASGFDRRKALAKHLHQVKSRNIYVNKIEFSEFLSAAHSKQEPSTNVDNVIRVIGLPLAVDKSYIANLFKGLKMDFENGIVIERDQQNRRSSTAFIELQTSDDYQAALTANVKDINHYVKVYRSTKSDFAKAVADNATFEVQGSQNVFNKY